MFYFCTFKVLQRLILIKKANKCFTTSNECQEGKRKSDRGRVKENYLGKKDLSREVKFKLRCDGGEGSRHIKIRKRNGSDRGTSMFPNKRKSLVCRGNLKVTIGAYG